MRGESLELMATTSRYTVADRSLAEMLVRCARRNGAVATILRKGRDRDGYDVLVALRKDSPANCLGKIGDDFNARAVRRSSRR